MDDQKLTMLVTAFIVVTALWEVVSGRTRDGRKSKQDWRMAFLATFMMVAVQRPLVLLVLTLGLTFLPMAQANQANQLPRLGDASSSLISLSSSSSIFK